jgi:hypothetical protein
MSTSLPTARNPHCLDGTFDSYLRDHRAGAVAGVRLAARCREHPTGDERRVLSELAEEIVEDRDELDAIMSALGVGPSRFKMAVGALGELAGRLKLNGRLLRRSTIAPLLEREALAAGVFTKCQLWRTLATAGIPGIEVSSIERLEARAARQLERLATLHDAAAAQAGRDAAAA